MVEEIPCLSPPLPSSVGLYRSGVTSPGRLRDTTVARQHLLDDTIESLRGSVDRKSKSHRLFIGPRGIGKTHLLSCIEDAVQSDEALNARVAVVRFPEESNRTLSFADFLIGMCGILKEVLEDEPLWGELFAAVQIRRGRRQGRRHPGARVPRTRNRRWGRTLLVMLENLGEVLGRQIRNRNDVAALRTFLMADNGCLLLATAPLHFDAITDVEQPFYDFFDIQILDALSFEETVEVIRLNLEWEQLHGCSWIPGGHAPTTASALPHDGRKPAPHDDALRADRSRVGHRRAEPVPPAARPDLAILPGAG